MTTPPVELINSITVTTAADIARFAVTQILDTTYIGTAPAVSN